MTIFYDDFLSSDFNYINSLQQANSIIEPDRDFAHFDLFLEKEEQEVFDQVYVPLFTESEKNEAMKKNIFLQYKESVFFDRCLNCNYAEYPLEDLRLELLEKITDESLVDSLIKIIRKISINTKYAIGNDNDYIVAQFRIIPSHFGDARWHTDGLFKDVDRRVIMTFKGEPTEFYQASEEFKKEILENMEDYSKSKHYNGIDITKINKATSGQATIFNNKVENAALHSSPLIFNSIRIVLIIDIVDPESMELLNLELEEDGYVVNQSPSSYLI